MPTQLPQGVVAKVVPWCDATAVAADPRVADLALPDGINWTMIVQAASEFLYSKTAHRWPGARIDSVRPHRLGDDCRCDLGGASFMWGAWSWSGIGGWWNRMFPEGWGCACVSSSELQLPGGPISSVTIVVDGVALTEGTDFQVYDNRRIVRMRDASGSYPSWPCCQRLNTPLGDPGTWAVTYTHGVGPPMQGQLAAYDFSVELGRYYAQQREKLPSRTSRVSRQGVDINIEAGALLGSDGLTGFPTVDLFLDSVNPHRQWRRARVYSPDTVTPSIISTSQ